MQVLMKITVQYCLSNNIRRLSTFEARRHTSPVFERESVFKGAVVVVNVPSEYQRDDFATELSSKDIFESHCDSCLNLSLYISWCYRVY